jgi:hypothetical protein
LNTIREEEDEEDELEDLPDHECNKEFYTLMQDLK